MPLFMDVLTLGEGVSTDAAVAAGEADLAIQDRFGVRCLRYWVSEAAGKVFYLVEADDLDLAETLHRETRGPIARETYPVFEHTWHRLTARRLGPEDTSTKGTMR